MDLEVGSTLQAEFNGVHGHGQGQLPAVQVSGQAAILRIPYGPEDMAYDFEAEDPAQRLKAVAPMDGGFDGQDPRTLRVQPSAIRCIHAQVGEWSGM